MGETAQGKVSSGEPLANRCWARGFGPFDYIRNGGLQLPQNPHLLWQQKPVHTKLLSPHPTAGLPLSSPPPSSPLPSPDTRAHTPTPPHLSSPGGWGSAHPSLSTSDTALTLIRRPEAGHRKRPPSQADPSALTRGNAAPSSSRDVQACSRHLLPAVRRPPEEHTCYGSHLPPD